MGNPRGDGGGRSNSSDPPIAPQNGSHLGDWGQQTPPVTKTTGAVASTKPAPATAAVAPPAPGEGAKGSGGGSGQCLREAAGGGREERGKGPALAPWPSRARPRPYFSVAFAGEDPGKAGEVAGKGGEPLAGGSAGVAEGPAAAVAAATIAVVGRTAGAGSEPPPFTPPPFTPSPRITLKRRLSGSWLSAVNGGRTIGGGGGEGGTGGIGNSGGVWGRELRRGGSPRLASSERGGYKGATQRREDRPPPLPPPRPPGAPAGALLPSAGPPSFSSSPPSLPVAHPQRPPPRPSPLVPPGTGDRDGDGDATAGSSSTPSSASASGGLRISLPLLLPPPPRRSAAIGAGAVGVSAGVLTQQGERQRQGELVSPPPSQPVFFLQVPATAAASVAQGGLEGQAWDAQYLGAGSSGESAAQEAPRTYGRTTATAGSSSTGGAGHSHGRRVPGDRQEGKPDDATVRGGGGGGSQDVDSTSGESSSGSSSSAPTSFGRAHRRVPPLAPSPTAKFVPHLVLVSLNLQDGRGARGGSGEKVARVVRAEAMDFFTAKQVTSVKLSPSARYVLLGVGVRGDGREAGGRQAPQRAATASQGDAAGVSAPSQLQFPLSSIYRSADLQPVNSMPSAEEDVNIACFHPEPGMGCVYGTKQGQVGIVRMGD